MRAGGDARHCATCRCASTITGQIANLIDADEGEVWTPDDVAHEIGYDGPTENILQTLNRMASEGKITRVRTGRYRSRVGIRELRESFGE